MIQFNLLPDIKQEFVKVNRTKRVIIAICVLASLVVIVILILLLTWDGLQKKNLHDINNDISTNKSQLTNMPNLNKVLTVQNQLTSLPALYSKNPVTSRLFTYLSNITPVSATISQLSSDYAADTMSITGGADSLATVNVFADTLKFTTYSIAGQSNAKTLAFSDVVLSSFSVTDKGVTYTLTFNFDPNLFNSTDQISLNVPSEVTTRSETQQPTDLFQQNAAPNASDK
jgi:hypothetical protein